MKLEEIKKEAQSRADRAEEELKAAKQLVKAIEGYEKLGLVELPQPSEPVGEER